MMSQAFYTGISGMKSSQYAIDVVSDNLANVSTVGFRGYETEFSSMFGDMIGTSGGGSVDSSVGVGATLSSTSMMQANGSLFLSDKSTDLAIDGDGWFGVKTDGDPVYTRDGTFTFDSNSDLVTHDGYHVLGVMGGNISNDVLTGVLDDVPLGNVASQEALNFPQSLTYPAEPSTLATFIGNIGTDDETRTMGAGVVDANGERNQLKLTFTQAATQVLPGSQWDVVATTETLDGTTIYDTQTGSVSFDSSGTIESSTLSSIDNNGTSVTIDIGSGATGVVSYSNSDISSSSISNGVIAGDLFGYDINSNGEVVASFTNGLQSSVGQIGVYHFQNDQGLNRLNGSRFEQSANSGDPFFFTNEAGENVIGAGIVNYKLEGANIEMTYGITELIILQRSFDANSKSITTADQMMQKALNMDA